MASKEFFKSGLELGLGSVSLGAIEPLDRAGITGNVQAGLGQLSAVFPTAGSLKAVEVITKQSKSIKDLVEKM